MSINSNRSKFNKALTNKEYNNIRYLEEFGPYFEDYWSKKSNIYSFKYREYRSWKYNRKTQYKIK